MNLPAWFFIMLSILNKKECVGISGEKKNIDERRRNVVYRESERKKLIMLNIFHDCWQDKKLIIWNLLNKNRFYYLFQLILFYLAILVIK